MVCWLAEGFPDMQLDQSVIESDDRKCLADAAAEQRL
jgi:hypothetical protein